MRRYALRDDQFDRIKDILPGREGHVGGTAADNRLFVEAVLFRFRAGIPWRDLPERFGDWKIVYQRFNRWAKSGVFERVFRLLASDHDNEYMMTAEEFVGRASRVARKGVAILARTVFLESVGRFEAIYSKTPPTSSPSSSSAFP